MRKKFLITKNIMLYDLKKYKKREKRKNELDKNIVNEIERYTHLILNI